MEGWEPLATAVLGGLAATAAIEARRTRDADDIGQAVMLGLGFIAILVYTLVLLFR